MNPKGPHEKQVRRVESGRRSSSPDLEGAAPSQEPVAAPLRRVRAPGVRLASQDVLRLQRAIGNRAVVQLLQAKLKLGPANDRYEREADQVAQQVTRQMEAAPVQREELMQAKPLADSITPVQRDDLEEDELAQAKPLHGPEGGDVDADVAHSIESAQGGGRPLDEGVRGAMEQGFGADFSRVRVHTGGQADALNRSLNARAFTTGSDIFFGQGAYQPRSSGGRTLIAHELTHTVQQGAAGVQRFVIQRRYRGKLLDHKAFKEDKAAKDERPSISGFTKKGRGHGLRGKIAALYTLLHQDDATIEQVRGQLNLIRAAFLQDKQTILEAGSASEQQKARATTVFDKWVEVVDENLAHLNTPLGGAVTEESLIKDLRRAYNEQGGIKPGDDLPEVADMLEMRFEAMLEKQQEAAAMEREAQVSEHFEANGAAFALGKTLDNDFWTPLLDLLPGNMEQPPNLIATVQQAVRPLLQHEVEEGHGYEDTRTAVKQATRQLEPRPLASVLVAKFFTKVETAGRAASDEAIPALAPPEHDAATLAANKLAEREDVVIAAADMSKEERRAFARALRQCPLIRQLLEEDYEPEEEVAPAQWKDDRNLQDEGNVRPVREGTNDVSENKMNTMKGRVAQANDFYKKMVSPVFLSTIAPPIINIHAKPSQSILAPKGFRAYQSSNEVHVAQDEDTPIIVHEVGHYVENNLPPDAWLDIRDLIAKRHGEAGGGTVASTGDTIFTRDEGRFKGEYPATGKYTSRAYGDIGSTEMMSMTLEYLSNPSKINKMIDKDPQQTAIILRAINRPAYESTPGIEAFDRFLPNPAG